MSSEKPYYRNRNSKNHGSKEEKWNVLTVREKGEQKFWTKIGVAFKNEGGSFRVMLDALPLNDTLFIMPPRD